MSAKKVKSKRKKVKVHKMVLTTKGHLVSDEEMAKYEVPRLETHSIEGDTEKKWGADIIKPPHDLDKLMSWLDVSVIHNSCIRTKQQDTVGIGYDLFEVEGVEASQEQWDRLKAFFEKCNPQEGITKVNKKVMLDFEGCGNGFYEIVRGITEADGIRHIYHVSGPTLRLCRDKERWVQKVGNKKVFFKVFGDDRILNKSTGNFVKKVDPEEAAHELIHISQYTHKSTYYGLPEWLPAIVQMFGEMKEKEYNLDFFSSYGVPAYAVLISGGEVDPEVKEEIHKYFEKELQSDPHKPIILELPEGVEATFEKLSIEIKDASFRMWRRDNRDDILTAHHVPPYRAGIVEKGQLGGGVAREVDEIYLDSVVNPRQEEFEWVLNQLIIKEGFGISGIELRFRDIDLHDEEAKADIHKKYFDMGARTPNQILKELGQDPYVGGDIYYVPMGMVGVGAEEKEEEEEGGGSDESDDADAVADYLGLEEASATGDQDSEDEAAAG